MKVMSKKKYLAFFSPFPLDNNVLCVRTLHKVAMCTVPTKTSSLPFTSSCSSGVASSSSAASDLLRPTVSHREKGCKMENRLARFGLIPEAEEEEEEEKRQAF